MDNGKLTLFGEVVPIPECSHLMLERYGSAERIAQLMVEAARKWKRQHPKKDVFEILSPEWRAYVKANI